MESASIIFEIIMIILFGISWPFNIVKAYKARTAKGTSLVFTVAIALGYICGIVSKILAASNAGEGYWTFLRVFAFVFYFINLAMVCVGTGIYFRNKKLDRAAQ